MILYRLKRYIKISIKKTREIMINRIKSGYGLKRNGVNAVFEVSYINRDMTCSCVKTRFEINYIVEYIRTQNKYSYERTNYTNNATVYFMHDLKTFNNSEYKFNQHNLIREIERNRCLSDSECVTKKYDILNANIRVRHISPLMSKNFTYTTRYIEMSLFHLKHNIHVYIKYYGDNSFDRISITRNHRLKLYKKINSTIN